MISRRRFLAGLGAGVLAAPLAAEGQQALAPAPGRVYRLGLLAGAEPSAPGADRLLEALLQGLREFGYTEGQNLVLERRYSGGRDEQLDELAAELVSLKVDVIVATATQPVHAAHRATTTIPIVMPNHSDPVGSRLILSLAHPGGNVTGLSIVNPDLTGKRLELLKETVPGTVRVAVLWNPTHQAHPTMLTEADKAAKVFGLQLQRVQARGLGDYEPAFSAMTRERASAVLVLGDATFWLHRARLAELAMKRRLPAMFSQHEHVEAGGLMSYGADLADNFRRAATYVAKILKGAKPADLPVEQPTKFELVSNLKTAKSLGLTIPRSLLSIADEVIQ